VVALLAGMLELDRRTLAPEPLRRLRAARRGTDHLLNDYPHRERDRCLGLAALATATVTELRPLLHSIVIDDLAWAVLIERPARWTTALATALLDDRFVRWSVVRRLVREQGVPRPDHPAYVLGMIRGLGGRDRTVLADLRADPDLLDQELWQLFEHVGGGETSLANADRWGTDGWSSAVLTLATEGRLDRGRLLDRCLATLGRDLNHYAARWFYQLFDALEPTPAELDGRADALLPLLGVSAPNVVAWAFGRVTPLARSARWPPEVVVHALAPVLADRRKGLVRKVFRLLDRLVTDAPVIETEVCRLAITALAHPSVDIQQAALERVEAIFNAENPNLVALLADHPSVVAPTLLPRVEALLRVDPPAAMPTTTLDASGLSPSLRHLFAVDDLLAQPVGGQWTLPAARFDGTELPRLRLRDALPPIITAEALASVAAQVIEGAGTPGDLERCLAAVGTMCGREEPSWEALFAPLRKRAIQLLDRTNAFAAEGPEADLAGVVVAWRDHRPEVARYEPLGAPSALGLLSRRAL
jgi:hypothetical protein